MTASNLAASFAVTQVEEGRSALSLDRNDSGNWTGGRVGVGRLEGTKYGISASAYPSVDIPGLTEAQAMALYRRDYWAMVAGDDLPIGLDCCLTDAAFNMGVGAAQRLAAQAIRPPISDVQAAIKSLSAARLAKMRSFRAWGRYGLGWARRIGRVEGKCLRMAMTAVGTSQSVQDQNIQTHAAAIAGKGTAQARVAAGSVVAAPALHLAVGSGHWIFNVIAGAFVLCAVAAIFYAVVNHARADGLIGKGSKK